MDLRVRHSQVVEDAEDHPEAELADPQDHRHLHLVGVEEREAVGCQVPDLQVGGPTNQLHTRTWSLSRGF